MHKNGKENYKIEFCDTGETVEFKGLPEGFKELTLSYTADEMRTDPYLILQSILKASEKEDKPQPALPLPTGAEAEDFIKSEFKKDDPSKFYDIIKRIGVGGFAKVFEVKRKSDGATMALKFIEPRNE